MSFGTERDVYIVCCACNDRFEHVGLRVVLIGSERLSDSVRAQ